MDCNFCHKEQFKYTCPKCNANYCSVACYKSNTHLKCSEEFYKSCIQAEMSICRKQNDLQKIYDILKRVHEADAGLKPEFDNLDSDDEAPIAAEEQSYETSGNNNDDDDDDDDLATRLSGIDINDADAVWEHLTDKERQEFGIMVANGDIMKLVPNYTPWWVNQKTCKIVELLPQKNNQMRPDILTNIPKFSEIYKKTPSPFLHYNLWNLLTAYSCVVKFFAGEHLTNPIEAAMQLINLSTTLKYGTNFEDAEDAIISVEMEALTSKDIPNKMTETKFFFVESRTQLQSDARQLMSSSTNKLAALSDILQLFKLAKQISKGMKNKEKDFLKLLYAGNIELNKTKIQHLIKKIEFLLSYVNKSVIENEIDD